MLRFLLSAASIFSLVTAMILPPAFAARRCGERMPVTLLSLYRGSDSIFVGRYEKTEDGEPTEDTADYTVIPIKKYFTISSALKGETQKLFTLEDNEYRYKNQQIDAEESEHGEEDETEKTVLQPGDSVLLFLKKNEDSGRPELTDFSDGLKKMTPETLSSYEARIRELKGIFASEKPSHTQLVAWMIRCAEDPHTRWEGTFELLQSFQNLDWQNERAAQAKEKPAEPEKGDGEEYEPESPAEFDTGDPNFAKAVTESQKLALSAILVNRETPKKTDAPDAEPSMILGDRELIELVKRWGDATVAAHLIGQLRQNSSDASQTSELMTSIASMLHDDGLTSVSEEYSNIQWESEDDIVGGDAIVNPPVAEVPAAAAPATENGPVVTTDVSTETGAVAGEPVAETESEQPKKKTYGELRAELLAKFLSRADKVIEIEQNRAAAGKKSDQ